MRNAKLWNVLRRFAKKMSRKKTITYASFAKMFKLNREYFIYITFLLKKQTKIIYIYQNLWKYGCQQFRWFIICVKVFDAFGQLKISLFFLFFISIANYPSYSYMHRWVDFFFAKFLLRSLFFNSVLYVLL